MHWSLIIVWLWVQWMEKCSLRRSLPEMKRMTWSTKHSKSTWRSNSLRRKKTQETSRNHKMFNQLRTFSKKTTWNLKTSKIVNNRWINCWSLSHIRLCCKANMKCPKSLRWNTSDFSTVGNKFTWTDEATKVSCNTVKTWSVIRRLKCITLNPTSCNSWTLAISRPTRLSRLRENSTRWSRSQLQVYPSCLRQQGPIKSKRYISFRKISTSSSRQSKTVVRHTLIVSMWNWKGQLSQWKRVNFN